MKLVLCGTCYDIFKLDYDLRKCKCGKSAGAYESDGWHAWYSGASAFPLGILNDSLRSAIVRQITTEPTERDFKAFVFPPLHDRFERRAE